MNAPVIVVLAGGSSAEREVSLGSGRAVAKAMAYSHPTRLVVVDSDALPPGLDPAREVLFSTLHGVFGEDGGMQRLCEAAGFHFAGCDSAGSDLCFDKWRTRQSVAAMGIAVAPGRFFSAANRPAAAAITADLGSQVVLKPNREGSSVGLRITATTDALAAAMRDMGPGDWIAEKRIVGRELTVGLLRGRAMGVVEIMPKSGVFDYASKYTPGMTEYRAPAPLPDEVTDRVRKSAETAFAACGCRDYARVDFMYSEDGELYLLEINTLPGMKATSLLPMSARCVGLDFNALCRELAEPAVGRFEAHVPVLR